MSYCKKCGNYLNDGVKYCNKCGTQANNSSFSQQNIRNYSKSSDRVILKAGVNNAYLTKSIIFSIIGIIILALLLYVPINLFYDFIAAEYDAHEYEMKEETRNEYEVLMSAAKTIRVIFIIIIIIDIIVNILKNVKITKNYLCVTESGIYGNASPKFGFAIVSFNLSFDQITRIKRKFGRIVIWRTTGSKLICHIDNKNEIYDLISQKIGYK